MLRLILYFTSFQFLFALNFEFSENTPQVLINNEQINNGFLGGLNYAITRWVDWDNDSDSDLFLLDEDGHIRFYENTSSHSELSFCLLYTSPSPRDLRKSRMPSSA